MGVAGSFFYDAVKRAWGDDILVKKGTSAVRNLSLARSEIKNISERVKGNASTHEISNLLLLLEKDIANAIQEWNDILPGISNVEAIYSMLKEKECELELVKKEKEQLDNKLKDATQLGAKEKQSLNKELVVKTQKILDLEREVSQLHQKTTPLSEILGEKSLQDLFYVPNVLRPLARICERCGKMYSPEIPDPTSSGILYCTTRLCPDCKSKELQC